MTEPTWMYRRGDLADGPWESLIDPRQSRWSDTAWQYTGLAVAHLTQGCEAELPGLGLEKIVVPLSGEFEVEHDGVTTVLSGRPSVFDGPTDVLYLGCSATGSIRGVGRVAVALAPTDQERPARYLPAEATPIELRGSGNASRQVHNFAVPSDDPGAESIDAARLIVCEVVTPAGNWSSYPPHKHDEEIPGHETALEEIYYFEAAPERGGPRAGEPFGVMLASSSRVGSIEMTTCVRSGDIVLIPYGYHGPAGALPGYDLYYLNVMAGPGHERAWRISDDPAHAWVRETWPHQTIDPRLPYRREHP